MEILDLRNVIIGYARNIVMDYERNIYAELKPYGNLTIGNDKKVKLQNIKVQYGIPHIAIKEDYKENIVVMKSSMQNAKIYMPAKYATSEAIEKKEESRKMTDEYLQNKPKIKEALENLIKAIEEDQNVKS